MDEFMMGVLMLIGIVAGLAVYFVPTIFAFKKQRINKGAIFCVNLFLGWSLIGWVAALVWAVKEPDNGPIQ